MHKKEILLEQLEKKKHQMEVALNSIKSAQSGYNRLRKEVKDLKRQLTELEVSREQREVVKVVQYRRIS